MKITTANSWQGEIQNATVTQIDVSPGESVTVEPGSGQRAVVLLVPADAVTSRRTP